jgi:predicted double-glycine peptidase
MRNTTTLTLLAALASGCASYQGESKSADPARVESEAGWLAIADFPEVRQSGDDDCGAAALGAVLRYWGRPVSPAVIEKELAPVADRGVRAGDLQRYAEGHGFSAFTFSGTLADLERELAAARPVIVGTVKRLSDERGLAHYEVVLGYHPGRRLVLTLDPARGFRETPLRAFEEEWARSERLTLVVSG